ncbi:Surfeit locus protein 6 [Sciurus carolinensis]|uniref:Surfeit locus protein 6 n=1 Tax=Sciurus carolinensis TaxID=30640 RepID=A0AA41N1V0_SCICA|nr:Surfeit locus protein 6 [Sciurus carolinensis]
MGSKDKSLGEKSPMTSGEMKSAVNKEKRLMLEWQRSALSALEVLQQCYRKRPRKLGTRVDLRFCSLFFWIKGNGENRSGTKKVLVGTEKAMKKMEVACMEPWELALIFIKLEVCEEAPASKDHCRKEKQQKMKGIFMPVTIKN